MSISVQTDVHCDFPSCGQWMDGINSQRAEPKAARAKGRRNGWVRRQWRTPFSSGPKRMVDLCPAHAEYIFEPRPQP